jgi:hypothetical protein
MVTAQSWFLFAFAPWVATQNPQHNMPTASLLFATMCTPFFVYGFMVQHNF